MGVEDLISVPSAHAPGATVERLTAEIRARGLTVFAEVDHAAGAAAAGLALRPTVLVLFGNARGGTPLMQSAQTLGLDLPLRALVWQDGKGRTWISCHDLAELAAFHGVPPALDSAVDGLSRALGAIIHAAAE